MRARDADARVYEFRGSYPINLAQAKSVGERPPGLNLFERVGVQVAKFEKVPRANPPLIDT